MRLELIGASEVPPWSEPIETHYYLHTTTLVDEVLR